MSADAVVPGPHSNAPGLTGASRYADTPEPAEKLSGAEAWAAVESLAALLEPEAFDPDQPADETWRHVTQQRALSHAATVIVRGFRRVLSESPNNSPSLGPPDRDT